MLSHFVPDINAWTVNLIRNYFKLAVSMWQVLFFQDLRAQAWALGTTHISKQFVVWNRPIYQALSHLFLLHSFH